MKKKTVKIEEFERLPLLQDVRMECLQPETILSYVLMLDESVVAITHHILPELHIQSVTGNIIEHPSNAYQHTYAHAQEHHPMM